MQAARPTSVSFDCSVSMTARAETGLTVASSQCRLVVFVDLLLSYPRLIN